ncbi:MAG: DUF2851 family protein [Chloroflexota bacterium]|nr:MAG: DUF2851 family protein [Chloroflexota bacterium]
MEIKITEKLISRIWQNKLVTELATENGEQIHIIHPGRSSNTHGCDFQDAVFTINGKMTTGNIEVHIKSSQWHSHGHHRNPKYNNIALHVVWWHDSQDPTRLQNGQAVPIICLGPFLNSTLDDLNKRMNLSGNSLPSCPLVGRHSNAESLSKMLTAAGEERFTAKTRVFRKALKEEDARQVLYRGIARALGYAQNAKPCEELANKLPFIILEGIKSEPDSTRQALLLGVAGLLPSQRHSSVEDRETNKLEMIWQSLGITETMKEVDWCFFRVRPDNFPTRRLIALSYLIPRHSKTELHQEILKLVKKAPRGAGHYRLENGLTVVGRGYWRNHLDFGIAQKKSSSLLGREKASAIAINTVLPFACAWGELHSDLKLKEKAVEIYRRYPKAGDNELTLYMKQQLRLNQEVRLSACQQQGLIHIFKTCCRHRSCTECPVALNLG